jgi:hypothetical protein
VVAKRARLEEGKFSHPVCMHCDDRRAVKTPIAPDVRWVVRQRFCAAHDDALVNFSISLQLERPEGWRDVVRWSVAHANYHRYQFSWDVRECDRRSYALVNTVADVALAYQHAVSNAYPHTEKWLDRWRRGLKR